ncbi:hypothetical protein [Streptomyces sp. NPDC001388]|uniref:hypothetical protein n=1 Tax=Streptomyces sp. NPDC001388 TaxID=3364568 RepID=UPI00367A6213
MADPPRHTRLRRLVSSAFTSSAVESLESWTREAMTNPSDRQRASLLALSTYLRRLLDDKRRRPLDDLLSRLIAVRDADDGRSSDTELLGTAVILAAAGDETTVNLLGNAVVALLDHPEQARRAG